VEYANEEEEEEESLTLTLTLIQPVCSQDALGHVKVKEVPTFILYRHLQGKPNNSGLPLKWRTDKH